MHQPAYRSSLPYRTLYNPQICLTPCQFSFGSELSFPVFQAAASAPLLATLNLSNNSLGSESAASLCQLLRRNKTLTSLDVSHNHFLEVSGVMPH